MESPQNDIIQADISSLVKFVALEFLLFPETSLPSHDVVVLDFSFVVRMLVLLSITDVLAAWKLGSHCVMVIPTLWHMTIVSLLGF